MTEQTLRICRVASPTIKSWRRRDEAALLSAVSDFVDMLRDLRLVLDLQVEVEASAVEDRLEGMDLALTRRRPSGAALHRVERGLGIYTQASALSVAVRLRRGSEARRLLAGDVLWNAEFVLYEDPLAGVASLPDPHLKRDDFVDKVSWCLGQETGVPDWVLSARGSQNMKRVSDAVLNAFRKNELKVQIN